MAGRDGVQRHAGALQANVPTLEISTAFQAIGIGSDLVSRYFPLFYRFQAFYIS